MKTGHVYFILNNESSVVKIGMTESEKPDSRLSALQTSHHAELLLIHSIECYDVKPSRVESDLHKIFSAYRLKGEWFSVTGLLSIFLRDCMSSHGVHDVARLNKKGPKWYLYSSSDDGSSMGVMGDKSGNYKNPLGAALYAYNNTKDSLAAENAGLRIIIDQYIQITTRMAAAIRCYERASAAAESMTDGLRPYMDGMPVSSENIALRIAKESDDNYHNLFEAASALTRDVDDFMGNATLFSDIKDKDIDHLRDGI